MVKPCIFDNCGGAAHARGRCAKYYQQWRVERLPSEIEVDLRQPAPLPLPVIPFQPRRDVELQLAAEFA